MEDAELKQEILACSRGYDHRHKLLDSDVDKARGLIEVIEKSRDDKAPKVGDIVICKGPEKVYENGHLDHLPETDVYSNVCTRPYTPFVWAHKDGGGIHCSTSGGYWTTEPDPKRFKFAGTRRKLFCAWGHCGPCGDGAFTFYAVVNCWEYESDTFY